MKNQFKIVFTLMLALMVTGSVYGQVDMSKWKIGVYPSLLQYTGPHGSELFHLKQSSGAIDVGLGYKLNSSFDLEGHFMGGNLNFEDADGNELFGSKVFDLNAQAMYNFANGYILKEDARISPFLAAGLGVSRFEGGNGLMAPLGGGLRILWDDMFSTEIRTAYKWNTQDDYDHWQHTIGFVYHIEGGGEKVEKPKDTDGDGIADIDDMCPEVAGTAMNNGCPEIDEETKSVMQAALEGIQFETGKDVLKNESYPILDNVVDVLNRHPEYKLSIEGHTDSSGDDQMNLDLSQRRAKRAMDYLIEKGINANRLNSTGYGETRPVDTNDTAEGRAKNRRVEFNIHY